MLISYVQHVCKNSKNNFFHRNKLEINDEVQSHIINKKGVSTLIHRFVKDKQPILSKQRL